MDWIMKIRGWLRVLLRRERFDSELEEEMLFHQEFQAEAYPENGMNAQEAQLAATRRLSQSRGSKAATVSNPNGGKVALLPTKLRTCL